MSTFVHAGCNANHSAEAPDTADLYQEILPQYGVQVVMVETSHDELVDLSSDIPTDTHLVVYRTPEGEVQADAVRSYTKVDIFDAYHDFGLEVIAIDSGFGQIKPKLYGVQATTQKVK